MNAILKMPSRLADDQAVSLERALDYISHLDLDYIVQAMCADNYPLPRWTLAEAKLCSHFYKNFLRLKKMHNHLSLVPTREIDEFWHNHILYTKLYFQDCQQIFGHYLHHDPASPNEDMEALTKAFLETKALYEAAFNEPYGLINQS